MSLVIIKILKESCYQKFPSKYVLKPHIINIMLKHFFVSSDEDEFNKTAL